MSGKYALIIGNTEYTDPGLAQLTAPGKDTESFARVLKDQDICAFGVEVWFDRHSVSSMLPQGLPTLRISCKYGGRRPPLSKSISSMLPQGL
jgi:hypothetical protein